MLVEATPTITIRELNHTLWQTFPGKPHVCNMTVSRALDGELITLKQAHNVSANRNSEDVKAARVAFAQYMYEGGIHQHRVYVDETGYNPYTCRTYGRAPRGQHVNRIVAGQRGSNVTLIAAISNLAGLFSYEIHVTSVTKEVLKNLMTSQDSVLGPEAAVILMDNAPCHAGIEQEFEDRVIKKLPPHSTLINPIENCFSFLKAIVKRQLNNIADRCDARAAHRHGVTCRMYQERLLQQVLRTAVPSIDATLCSANYQHFQTYLQRCIARKDIWD
ncbi:putative DDE superfamily endonuclease domain-containing protein 7 [Homarus americanus]|uniref:Putative DDE superfamily endonuclease domain-containing protein 7 n=1 Tax=Homarus americanus TaxID=6706 RepID=A0A8J5JR17_HOMAM|nr:putative DDE superfamily endonuclease domain-containing protein 7 [Homarus americanus]